jgi:hypothetical protein
MACMAWLQKIVRSIIVLIPCSLRLLFLYIVSWSIIACCILSTKQFDFDKPDGWVILGLGNLS